MFRKSSLLYLICSKLTLSELEVTLDRRVRASLSFIISVINLDAYQRVNPLDGYFIVLVYLVIDEGFTGVLLEFFANAPQVLVDCLTCGTFRSEWLNH